MQAELLVYDVDCIDETEWACLAGRSPEGLQQPQLHKLQQVTSSALLWGYPSTSTQAPGLRMYVAR